MSSFFDEISRNRIKSFLLMFVFSILFIGVIYLFSILMGMGPGGFALAVIITLGYAAFSYFAGDKMVLKLSGAQPVDEKSQPLLYDTVEGLALASQIKMPALYIMNDANPNAFATGRDKNHASVVVTKGLLSMMNKSELEGVVSHELSHVSNNDVQFMMLAVVFAGVIGILSAFARNLLWFGGAGREERGNGGSLVLIALALWILAPITALLLRLAISRRREYMADANGARLTRNPQGLADALKKIEKYTQSPKATSVKTANEATAQLFFANPFAKKDSFAAMLSNIFSTHPPIDERIKRLEHMY